MTWWPRPTFLVDHPREYGENRKDEERTEAAQWIIPANTGRIWVALMISVSAGDHPREYGENVRLLAFWLTGVGSSPRIRGECYGDSPGSG